jgi:hypothetical protein
MIRSVTDTFDPHCHAMRPDGGEHVDERAAHRISRIDPDASRAVDRDAVHDQHAIGDGANVAVELSHARRDVGRRSDERTPRVT